jgi:hypothetical protein
MMEASSHDTNADVAAAAGAAATAGAAPSSVVRWAERTILIRGLTHAYV